MVAQPRFGLHFYDVLLNYTEAFLYDRTFVTTTFIFAEIRLDDAKTAGYRTPNKHRSEPMVTNSLFAAKSYF